MKKRYKVNISAIMKRFHQITAKQHKNIPDKSETIYKIKKQRKYKTKLDLRYQGLV